MLREDERTTDAEQREDITKDARYSVAQVAGGTGGVGWMEWMCRGPIQDEWKLIMPYGIVIRLVAAALGV